MKTFILILSIISLISGESMDKQESKTKPTQSTINVMPKQEFYLQQQQQQQQFKFQQPYHQIPIKQVLPLQMLPRPYYVPQAQPQAMIIIAQPAIVPSSLIYGNNPANVHQLLQYIQNNPQTKYQQLMQTTYMQPIVSTPNYILAPQPQLLTTIPSTLAPTTNQLSYTTTPTQATQQQQQQQHQELQQQQQSQIQPLQLNQIAHLAQLAAQQYMAPIKTVTPIVTGFEHFTPEQQAQIKAQLTNHLGTNFHAVSATNNGQFSAKYPTPEQGFVPSQQIKNDITSNGAVKDKL